MLLQLGTRLVLQNAHHRLSTVGFFNTEHRHYTDKKGSFGPRRPLGRVDDPYDQYDYIEESNNTDPSPDYDSDDVEFLLGNEPITSSTVPDQDDHDNDDLLDFPRSMSSAPPSNNSGEKEEESKHINLQELFELVTTSPETLDFHSLQQKLPDEAFQLLMKAWVKANPPVEEFDEATMDHSFFHIDETEADKYSSGEPEPIYYTNETLARSKREQQLRAEIARRRVEGDVRHLTRLGILEQEEKNLKEDGDTVPTPLDGIDLSNLDDVDVSSLNEREKEIYEKLKSVEAGALGAAVLGDHRLKCNPYDFKTEDPYQDHPLDIFEREDTRWDPRDLFDESKGPRRPKRYIGAMEMSNNQNIWRTPRSEYTFSHVIKLGYHTKIIPGGRLQSSSALVVIGTRRGSAGLGYGKASKAADALQQALLDAYRNAIVVDLYQGRTIPMAHLYEKYNATKLHMRSAPVGHGVAAGGVLQLLCHAVGLKDVMATSYGSKNPHNVVRCFFKAMARIRSAQWIAKASGKRHFDHHSIWRNKHSPPFHL